MDDNSGYKPLLSRQYKSLSKMILICINVCLSSFYFGYALAYMGTLSDFTFIMDYYSIGTPSTKQLTQSLVEGCVPVGAIFGTLLSAKLLKHFSRRNGFLVTNVMGVISLLLYFIRSPVTLVLGRVIQGLCTGIFVAIIPLYINQIVTPDLRNLGTMNQIFIAISQAFCYSLYYVLTKITQSEQVRWIWVSEFPLIIMAIQSFVFLFIFPYETPKYLFEHNLLDKATSLIHMIYNSDHIEEAISQYRTGTVVEEVSLRNSEIALEETENRVYTTSKLAIFMSLYLPFTKQMTGINAVTIYGKEALKPIVSEQFYQILPIIIDFMPAVTAILTTFLLAKFGRKQFILFGLIMYCICLSLISIGFFVQYSIAPLSRTLISIGLVLHTSNAGLTMGSIVYLYLPEIVQPKIMPYSSMVNLIGAALCILAFPLLKEALPNEGYLFMIFFSWCFIAFFVVWKFMVETKDKSRAQVFEEYEKKKIC